jgi:hypothetical protein
VQQICHLVQQICHLVQQICHLDCSGVERSAVSFEPFYL